MYIKKNIPNIITLLNLFSGLIAVMFAAINQLEMAAYFVFIGIFFDYFDGFTARLFNVEDELGKQLDSLADMVTSGVVPGIVMFQLIRQSMGQWTEPIWFTSINKLEWLPFLGLIITLASAYRLANFNIDARQNTSFIGLPTPALTLFVLALPLILNNNPSVIVENLINNPIILIIITLLGSYLMNSNIKMFALKFKTYGLKENFIKYSFLLLAIIFLIFFQYLAIPIILIIYILISIVQWLIGK